MGNEEENLKCIFIIVYKWYKYNWKGLFPGSNKIVP